MILRLFCQELQADISHCVCVSDNVAPPGEEQVEVFAYLPNAADVESPTSELPPSRLLARWDILLPGYHSSWRSLRNRTNLAPSPPPG